MHDPPTLEYYLGTRVGLDCTFRNSAEALTNPSTVTAYIRSPNGVLSDYVYGTDGELTRTSTGLYHLEWTPTSPGKWTVTFKGTGTVIATDVVYINVAATPAVP